MKKTVAAVLAVLMLLTAAAAAETIQIGIILPYTGNLALYGESMYEGATLAAKEINEKGGVLGCELEIVKYDDMNDPNESLNGFNSLYMDGVELMIGPLSSTCTAQIVDAANNEGVVLLTATATNDALDTEDNYVFRSCYLDSFQGAIGAAFAYQQGYKKVGVVYCASDTYSKGLGDSFIAACEKYGVEIVAVESTATLDYTEYTNQFLAMVNAGAELVYCPYYYDVIGPYVVNQARAAGFNGIILGADGFDGVPDYVVPGSNLDDFNNVYWNNHFDPTAESEMVQNFVANFKAAYNDKTPNALCVLPYDGVYILASAIERAGAADAESVREALADTSAVYECVTGTFNLDETGAAAKGAAFFSFYHEPGSDVVTTIPIGAINELP